MHVVHDSILCSLASSLRPVSALPICPPRYASRRRRLVCDLSPDAPKAARPRSRLQYHNASSSPSTAACHHPLSHLTPVSLQKRGSTNVAKTMYLQPRKGQKATLKLQRAKDEKPKNTRYSNCNQSSLASVKWWPGPVAGAYDWDTRLPTLVRCAPIYPFALHVTHHILDGAHPSRRQSTDTVVKLPCCKITTIQSPRGSD